MKTIRRTGPAIDLPLLLITLALMGIGIVTLFSITHADPHPLYKKQILWMALGMCGLIVAAITDYSIYTRFSRHLYIANLILLMLALLAAHKTNGASRWIRIAGFEFQPSETAKLIVILTLGAFLSARRETIRSGKTFLLSLFYVIIPTLLIFKQPDLGTALVVITIWASMVFIAGANIRHLIMLLLGGVLLLVIAWHSNKLLKPYQKQRLITFINPQADTAGSGYHVTQARIAIGSGRVFGKGLLHSTQVKRGYIPEKQTDFVFTDIGEELGFVGGALVTLLYAGLLLRGYQIIAAADQDMYAKLIGTGIVAMIAFHVIVNIGMNIGILPVAGVPLPFISSGGSNVIVTLYCIGLLESISIHHKQMIF